MQTKKTHFIRTWGSLKKLNLRTREPVQDTEAQPLKWQLLQRGFHATWFSRFHTEFWKTTPGSDYPAPCQINLATGLLNINVIIASDCNSMVQTPSAFLATCASSASRELDGQIPSRMTKNTSFALTSMRIRKKEEHSSQSFKNLDKLDEKTHLKFYVVRVITCTILNILFVAICSSFKLFSDSLEQLLYSFSVLLVLR